MAWTSRSHPQTRWQVRYRDGTTQRSVGTYPAKAEALSVRRAVEHRDHVAYSDQLPPGHASMLFGEYVTTIWWSAWKPAHPRSAEGTSSKLTARSCPASATCPGPAGRARRCRLAARPGPRGTLPRSIATYLSLLGTICNAAVDTGYLDHSSSPSPAADDDPRPSPPRRQSHPCRAWSGSPARRCSASPPPPPAQRRHGHDLDPAGAPSPSTSKRSTPWTPTVNWSAAAPATWSSPAPAAPAAPPTR